MQTASILNIGHAIQLAVAPVFLLAGVGALLAVLTNRLARIIDRVHFIERQLETVVSAEQREENARATVSLARRARFIHWAISLCTTCDLLVCVVVAMIFISHELGVDLSNGDRRPVHRRDAVADRRPALLPAGNIAGYGADRKPR